MALGQLPFSHFIVVYDPLHFLLLRNRSFSFYWLLNGPLVHEVLNVNSRDTENAELFPESQP